MSCDMSNTDQLSLLCVSWTSPELRWNNFPHCEQEYGPSPVWHRRWTLNSGVTWILLQSILNIWAARRQLLFLPTEDKRTWWQIKERLDAKWRRDEKLASCCILISPTWVCLAPGKRWNKTTAVWSTQHKTTQEMLIITCNNSVMQRRVWVAFPWNCLTISRHHPRKCILRYSHPDFVAPLVAPKSSSDLQVRRQNAQASSHRWRTAGTDEWREFKHCWSFHTLK